MATVADVLKKIERIKKDLEYVRSFQDKWREQRDRFPKIYEGIVEQERAFVRKIEDLRQLRVDTIEAMAAEPEATPAPSPAIVPGQDGPPPADPTSSDDKRAAAISDISEKLRKRAKGEKTDGAILVEPSLVAEPNGLGK